MNKNTKSWAGRLPWRAAACVAVGAMLAACGGGGGASDVAQATADRARVLAKDTDCDHPEVQRLLEISVHANSEEREANIELVARCGKLMIERELAAEAQGNATQADRERPLTMSQPVQQTLNFESPHVHPLDLTPDGKTLLAVNTAAHTLEVFQVSGSSLSRVRSIPVGLDPVTVRARSNEEAWVVNHVADTVSVVNLTLGTVVQTLETDNEPSDLVFAGSPQRAFVTASKANRINVFDAGNPAGVARQTLNIQGLNPRALAVGNGGSTVYAAIFESGNGTRMSNGLIVRDTVLADNDVAVINANTLTVGYQRKLMTMVMAIAVNPASGQVSVVGTELTNDVATEAALNGVFVRSRLASFAPGSTAAVRDLNPHLTYAVRRIDPALRAQSVADPRGLAWRSSGTQAFVTGMGSGNVAVIDAAGARLGQFDVGAGPTGIVLKDAENLGFVLNRFDGTISVIDLNGRRVLGNTAFDDPTPEVVKKGRRFLFDARLTSGLGQASCASCHVDARTDRLAWNLNDSSAPLVSVPVASNTTGALTGANVSLNGNKGPMVTQTLIDIMGFPRFHWRGDRARIDDFNGTFTALLSGDRQLNSTEMADLKAYLSTLWLQPNPYRRIDDSRPSTVVMPDGRTVTSPNMTSLRGNNPTANNCLRCHYGQGKATRNFGVNAEIGSNIMAPSLVGIYNKLGSEQGLSGFGFFHNSSADILRAARLSTTEQNPAFLAELMTLEGPSGPLVGAEMVNAPHAGIGKGLTVNGPITSAQSARLTQIQTIAQTSSFAALVAHVRFNGVQRGFVYLGNSAYRSDAQAEAQWTQAQLLDRAAKGEPVTFMLVAEGTETRIALDRDLDGVWNFDQIQAAVKSTAVVGPDGGTAFTDPFASGQRLTGVRIGAGYWIDSIQTLTASGELSRHGGTGGALAEFTLPEGEYLVRVFGKQGANALFPAISQISFMTNTGRVFGPYAEGLGQDPTTPFDIVVPAGRRIVGFTGRAGQYLNGIGALYVQDVPAPTPQAGPIFGSGMGVDFSDSVVAGQVLTGVRINAGYWIDSIQGLAVPGDLPLRGGGGGAPGGFVLKPDEYLVRIFGNAGSNPVVPSISQISFVTNTGRVYGPFGEGLGQDPTTPFDYTVPSGHRIVGFTGRAGDYLHAIGVLYLPR